MGYVSIYDYNYWNVRINGSMSLPFIEGPDLVLLDYEDMVNEGQWNLYLQNAAKEAAVTCLLDAKCVEQAIRAKISKVGLDDSILGTNTIVTVRGVNGAEYTQLIFYVDVPAITNFIKQMCDLGFPNRGGCPLNAGYTWLAGTPHFKFELIFRDNNAFNSLNIHVSFRYGMVAFDIDQGNPTTGIAGFMVHIGQWDYNFLTGNDNRYRCKERCVHR